jgi:hypothetical protein
MYVLALGQNSIPKYLFTILFLPGSFDNNFYMCKTIPGKGGDTGER